MANRVAVWISLCVWMYNAISVVLAADECKTHDDCKDTFGSKRLCCLNIFGRKRCVFGKCENDYCRTDDDCADSALCCRSRKCVKNGCSGCNKDTDCHYRHHCCKKTYPFSQTFCALNCIDVSCNSNDDCGGLLECCRSGKCTTKGCYEQCTTNSECDFDEYCCKEKKSFPWQVKNRGCSKSCVGEKCNSDDDCGGPNECCISNKCVTSDCDFGKCSADCTGKSCGTSKDCGDLGEICNSYNICEPIVRTAYPTPYPFISTTPNTFISTTPYPAYTAKSRNSSHSSFPMWVTVVVVSLFIMLISLAMIMICHFKRKRTARATHVLRGIMDLQNTRNRVEAINGMPGAGFPSPPPPYENVALENTRNHRAAIQSTHLQFSESPPPYSEIDAFQNFHHQGNQLAMPSNAYQYENEGYEVPNNPPQSPTFLNALYPNDSQQSGSPPPYYPGNTSNNPP